MISNVLGSFGFFFINEIISSGNFAGSAVSKVIDLISF